MRFEREGGKQNIQPWQGPTALGFTVEYVPRLGVRDRELRLVVGKQLCVTLCFAVWYVRFGPMWGCATEEE